MWQFPWSNHLQLEVGVMALASSFRWLFSWWCPIFTADFKISSELSLIKDDLIGPSYYPIICRYGGRSTLIYHNSQLLGLQWLSSVTDCINTWLFCIQFYFSIDTSCLPLNYSFSTDINNTHIPNMNDHILKMAHQQPSVHHLTNQMESTSIDEQPIVRRVIVHSTQALARGMARWKFAAVGKLYADGELLPKAAERAAKAAWTHLQSPESNWRFILIGLDPNIYAIRFENEDDQNSILYGTAWNFYNNLVVLRAWTTSRDYHDLDFSSQIFRMEFKRLLPEFLTEEMIRLFAEIGDQVIDVEVPKFGTKFRDLVEISLTTPHLEGIMTASGAGASHWIGFFCEGQPRNICSKCRVIDHDPNLCSDRQKNRIEAESQLRDFGQALIIPQQWCQPNEEIQLFRQHHHQRRDMLRPMRTRVAPPPPDGMQLSYFTATATPSHIEAHRVPLHQRFGTCSETGSSKSSRRKRTRIGPSDNKDDETTDMDATTERQPTVSWDLALQVNNANAITTAG